MIANQYLTFIAVVIACYFVGSVPTSYLLGRCFANLDIRTYGSKNVGASNLYVNGGRIIGIIAGITDCLIKGTFSIIFLDIILGLGPYVLLAAGVSLVAGHNWSIFIGFKGGRGIATAFGVIVGLQMWEEILILTLFVGILGRLVVYKDSGFWCFVSIGILPLLCFAYGEPSAFIGFSLFLGGLLITKRLITNESILPTGSKWSIVFCRLIFDRDIISKTSWIERGRS